MSAVTFVVALLLAFPTATAWTHSPNTYTLGQPVAIQANAMTSLVTQFPKSAYSIKTCPPPMAAERARSFAELWRGEQVVKTLYQAEMQVNSTCRKLCNSVNYSAEEMKLIQQRIKEQYRVNLLLDNHAIVSWDPSDPDAQRIAGCALGWSVDGKEYIANHLAITIEYQKAKTSTPSNPSWSVVGFFAREHSVKHSARGSSCQDGVPFNPNELPYLRITGDEGGEITWSYSVTWREAPAVDPAVRRSEPSDAVGSDAHSFAIMNNICMTFLLGVCLVRIIRRCMAAADKDVEKDWDNLEYEMRWMLLHGDVFRSPEGATWLAILTGAGCQLLGVALVAIVLRLAGYVTQPNGMVFACLYLIIPFGGVAGYVTARLCKYFDAKSWTNIVLTAAFFPGTLIVAILALNIVHHYRGATTAQPFPTLLRVGLMWFAASLLFTLAGGALGFWRRGFEGPCKVSTVKREIPPQRWYKRQLVPAVGVLPFGAVFMEFVCVFAALWEGRVCRDTWPLFLGLFFCIVASAQASIIAVFMQLCSEDYNWWWRSFWYSASAGLFVFLTSIYYFFSRLSITQASSATLYFGHMFLISCYFAVCTGSVGFLAAKAFLWRIFTPASLVG